jgi:hypothetical protein
VSDPPHEQHANPEARQRSRSGDVAPVRNGLALANAAPIPERRAGATYRFLQRMSAMRSAGAGAEAVVGQRAQNATRGNVRRHDLMKVAEAVRQAGTAIKGASREGRPVTAGHINPPRRKEAASWWAKWVLPPALALPRVRPAAGRGERTGPHGECRWVIPRPGEADPQVRRDPSSRLRRCSG